MNHLKIIISGDPRLTQEAHDDTSAFFELLVIIQLV